MANFSKVNFCNISGRGRVLVCLARCYRAVTMVALSHACGLTYSGSIGRRELWHLVSAWVKERDQVSVQGSMGPDSVLGANTPRSTWLTLNNS